MPMFTFNAGRTHFDKLINRFGHFKCSLTEEKWTELVEFKCEFLPEPVQWKQSFAVEVKCYNYFLNDEKTLQPTWSL